MSKFYKTPEGRILLKMCHDHAHGGSRVVRNVNLIKEKINDISKEDIIKHLDRILEGYTTCKSMVDYGYTEIKKLRGYD